MIAAAPESFSGRGIDSFRALQSVRLIPLWILLTIAAMEECARLIVPTSRPFLNLAFRFCMTTFGDTKGS